jgi:lysozyme
MASQQQLAWLASMVPAAEASMATYGVPASVTLAQCILESAWGQSSLAVKANNFFGIKSEGDGHYMSFPTHEYESGRLEEVEADFEAYPDPRSCFVDHARLLAEAPRYAPAMAVKNDAAAFCAQLQACGYSTSPTYAEMLQTIIHCYDLSQYDNAPQPSGDPQ